MINTSLIITTPFEYVARYFKELQSFFRNGERITWDHALSACDLQHMSIPQKRITIGVQRHELLDRCGNLRSLLVRETKRCFGIQVADFGGSRHLSGTAGHFQTLTAPNRVLDFRIKALNANAGSRHSRLCEGLNLFQTGLLGIDLEAEFKVFGSGQVSVTRDF